MKISLKISVLASIMLSGASVFSQSDSLGMPGDNLDLNAVLSIFKQSSTVEDFEKKLNSADTKVNNLDLNSDGQVDYLRVIDYGKDDFHSIVIQDPVSKTESQDVAVVEIVKKGDNTAHVQIVGDESLYGKNYVIEPEDQAPLNKSSDKNNASVNDDVYASQNSSGSSSSGSSNVMINVWGWPSVSYLYSPGYSYWVSPWYWGYYPGWYSPWSPYGYYAYRRGFYGYNYGFYGYRRYRPAFAHVHSYYYGRRVSSGYVQKTAPNYNRRVNSGYNNGVRNQPGSPNRKENMRNNGAVNPNGNINHGRVQNSQPGTPNMNRKENMRQNNGTSTQRTPNQASPNQGSTNRKQNMRQGGGAPNTNSAPQQRANQGSPNVNQGGGRKAQFNGGGAAPSGGNGARMSNPGGARMSNPGGGGGRMSNGGGGNMGGGGGHMGGGGHGGSGGGHR